MTAHSPSDAALAKQLEALSPPERLKLLEQELPGKLIASTSFGLQAAVMLHLIKEHAPSIPIIFIDTGYLFRETYLYMEELQQHLDLEVTVYQPLITPARQEALHGRLWEQGPEGLEKYGKINKVEPMNRALRESGATHWISGLRRDQSSTRADRPFAEQQGTTIKIYPILDWDQWDIEGYFRAHNLPRHPLENQGYQTMGDWHSTKKTTETGNAESSRFGGLKYECGLHLDSGDQDFQI